MSTLNIDAQVRTPQPSPLATLNQVVGLTNFEITYSRPSMNEREIFGGLVPYGELWRTAANKNTMITIDDDITIGGKSLKAGTYALFSRPGKKEWNFYIYTDTENWGTPREWKTENIAAEFKVNSQKLSEAVESFTIDFNNFTKNGAHLVISWEKTSVHIPVEVPTDKKVMASIEGAMKDPKPNDYYSAAVYYMQTDRDIEKAKMWIDKAMESRDDKPFWMLRQQSLIYAEAGDKEMAIKFAKESLKGAEAAKNRDYINMNKASLKEWGAL
jgi:hypothetical protein